MIKLPKILKIGGFDIQVVEWHPYTAQDQAQYGHFSAHQMKIEIDMTSTKQQLKRTIWHEILHAIFYVYSIKDEDKEERIVETLSKAIIQVFKDNSWVYKELLNGKG